MIPIHYFLRDQMWNLGVMLDIVRVGQNEKMVLLLKEYVTITV